MKLKNECHSLSLCLHVILVHTLARCFTALYKALSHPSSHFSQNKIFRGGPARAQAFIMTECWGQNQLQWIHSGKEALWRTPEPSPSLPLVPHCLELSSLLRLLHFPLHSVYWWPPASFLSTLDLALFKNTSFSLTSGLSDMVSSHHYPHTCPIYNLHQVLPSQLWKKHNLKKTDEDNVATEKQPLDLESTGWEMTSRPKESSRRTDHRVGSEKHTLHHYPGALLIALCSRRQGHKVSFYWLFGKFTWDFEVCEQSRILAAWYSNYTD